MAATFADHPGDIFMASVVFAREALISARLLQRIEIGTLHIFDNRELECFRVARFDHAHGHIVQASALRGAPAPFARDDLINVLRSTQARTTTGWMMPRSLMETANSSSSTSEKLRRGLRGLGRRNSMGTRR